MAAFAQKQNVYFMKNNGKQVTIKDSADYIRIVSEPDSGTVLYNVKEYFTSGKAKLIGKSSKIEYNVLEGQCVTYFPSGKRRQIADYKGGQIDGDEYNYYPNGKFYTYKKYLRKQRVPGGGVTDICLIQSCNDSTGKVLAADGNGHFIGFHDDFIHICEEGDVKSGSMDGEWKGTIDPGYRSTFTETYNAGKFIGGQSVDTTGKIYLYSKRKVSPEYVGGEDALGRFLQKNIRYPSQARKNNIQALVYIGFVVEKDGTLTNAEVQNIVNEELAAEALRVLKLSPRWKPGKYFGAEARVQFTLPINFSLGE